MLCGRGHTDGVRALSARSEVPDTGLPGSLGAAGAATADGATETDPRSPPITAAATAVACLLRPIRTSRPLPYVPTAPGGLRAHHPGARVSMCLAVLPELPEIATPRALWGRCDGREWLKTAHTCRTGERNVTQGTLGSLS
ncbi:hypothetical protein GCM10010328_55950 [Streptomyces rubiginosohelvolus]|uniref:Uncharacterized protein n=1 Tax=Streptomyces rubiginosohelvolus TaxID=67362 RepID=A0ABQ3C977_9ACTN|nr:hypothetical protein GCM10010328_55950 [Streptomyces pluricolorescens]